jgi:hypothetical protein
MVWGPYEWFEGDEPFVIMNSFARYE